MLQQREHDSVGVGEQREEQMLRLDRLVIAGDSLVVRLLQGALSLDRQLVQIHPSLTSSKSRLVMAYKA